MTMSHTDENEVRGLFDNLHVWGQHGTRAPHKPLLALWSIGRCLNGQSRLVPFELVDREVGDLIREFGPPRAHTHADYPFWRMRNDGVWEVASESSVRVTPSGDAFVRDLKKPDVQGGFLEGIYLALRHNTSLAGEVACSLARAHFPLTLQGEVLEATGITPTLIRVPRSKVFPRDPRFRRVVLSAYNFECAICGFAVRFGDDLLGSNASIAVDAAHIKWHQALGPATIQNGIALCALHHRLFDFGAFTLSEHQTVVVAGAARGRGSSEWLWRFDGQALPTALRQDLRPSPDFLNWHMRNVFRGRGDTSQ